MRHRSRFTALLITSLLFVPTAAGAQDLSAPENVVRLFVSAVARGDLDGALAVCAVDESARGYDFTLAAKRLQAITPFSLAPSEYPLYAAINRRLQEFNLASRIKFFVYGFLAPELTDGKTIPVDTDEEIERYRQALDPKRIQGLQLVDAGIPSPDIFYSPRNLENFRQIARTNGADEAVELVALYRLNGQYYVGGFQLLRYGKAWKITALNSSLAGTSTLGTAAQASVEEFNRLTGR
jgi:hypothetical protein